MSECHCGKRRYMTRKDAKRELSRLRRARGSFGQVRPYECPTLPGIWHIGHLPVATRQGTVTAAEWYGRA